jgi:hypothetical protein
MMLLGTARHETLRTIFGSMINSSRSQVRIMGAALLLVAACVAPPAGAIKPSVESGSPVQVASSTAAGCTLPTLDFNIDDTNDDSVKYGGKTNPPELPIWTWGTKISSISDITLAGKTPPAPTHGPNNLPVRAVLASSDSPGEITEVRTYYVDGVIGPAESERSLLVRGGAVLTEQTTRGLDAARIQRDLGEDATPIKIGPYDAALVHSSPMPGDFRAFGVWWSDGQIDYHLLVNGSAREAIASAQSMFCSQ